MEDTRTFTEIFAVVKYKLEHRLPMMGAKEEWFDDIITDAAELFGNDFIFSENNNA